MQTQSLVTLIPWTFIAQILNLFLQMYLIKRFLFKPINRILEQRRERANAEIRDAEAAKAEAEEMRASYEKDMHEARERASEIVSTAQKNAGKQSDAIIREANLEAAAIREKAEREIELEKKKAVQEIKDDIGGIAVELAEKVIERELDAADHRELIDSYIRNVGEAG